MRISAKAEYACLALIELAKPGDNGSPRRVREIALAQGIPERYLVQILLQLKAAGLVQSARGSAGGYHLAGSAEEISVADIVSIIDGPGDPPRQAVSQSARNLSAVLESARAAEREVLASTTIADLSDPATLRDWVL
jgi:Rrf2 family protein